MITGYKSITDPLTAVCAGYGKIDIHTAFNNNGDDTLLLSRGIYGFMADKNNGGKPYVAADNR